MKFRRFLVVSTFPMLLSVATPIVAYAQTTEPTVQTGSTGSAVVTLQKDLNSLGYSVGSVDGDFGPMTRSGVETFQRAHGLTVDGIVGPETWGAILSAVNGRSFSNVDLRYSAPSSINANSINTFLSKNGSPMTGLGQSFINAQNTYGVDANYLVSHAILESAWGKSQIALAKNNLFGYGAYDANPGDDAGMFPSDAYAIQFQAWEVRNNYLNPGGSEYVSPTLNGMNVNYATDPNWANSIATLMNELATSSGSSVSDYTQYPSSTSVPQPKSNVEPAYNLNGATGTTASNAYYGGVPYYPSTSAGISDMYFATLQNGSSGEDVTEVQRYLNAQIGAKLTVDGQYGPATAAAVKEFEAKHGLKQDGVWSYSMWTTYIYTGSAPTIPTGQSVQIDEIEQGMAGPYVVPWYHVANRGWVDSQYVKFTNVYRVTVRNQTSTSTSIPVYSSSDETQQIATLHNGDFVVAQSASATNGFYQIQVSTQAYDSSSGGTPLTGYISSQVASLTAQQ
ncbi:peptidoglycan-binding protein [Alicyclobacillus fastidiosus]|uniref:Peptidoglycan-binding protein n=1 Tax=Alicyclobacillus fastidiosus TaxID=392011 RepID=A0ABY6ZGB4_9BACL|nr:peptidoglycan-binding protein [Alicyclobacillus fastidiosus]WAH41770.1 peptidoglycan-binding protein [Alicyclobacillus fastidiosus]GMA63463.1 hypothetical protein GCM10025859_39030 [Alicyclobacillus fastidiosus]